MKYKNNKYSEEIEKKWKNSKERADLLEPLFIIGFIFSLWLISIIIVKVLSYL